MLARQKSPPFGFTRDRLCPCKKRFQAPRKGSAIAHGSWGRQQEGAQSNVECRTELAYDVSVAGLVNAATLAYRLAGESRL